MKNEFTVTTDWIKNKSHVARHQMYSPPTKKPPAGREWVNRLSWISRKYTLDGSFHDKILVKILASENSNVDWVFDTNFFIANCDERFWKSIIKEKKKLLMPTEIFQELAYWLATKKTNPIAASYVESNIINQDLFKIIDLPSKNNAVLMGFQYYVNLLSQRKRFDFLVENQLKEKGKSAAKDSIGNFIVNKIGRRAKRLSSEFEVSKNKDFFRNDEIIVWKIIIHALMTQRETAVITADEGLFEQFYKSLWFLDTHYRAMLFAEILSCDPFRFKFSGKYEDKPEDAFIGFFKTYKKESDTLTELLPFYYNCVPIHCYHIKQNVINEMSFSAESAMSHVIKTKGLTEGNSTAKFGKKNCHIYLGGLIEKHGNVAVLSDDIKIDFKKNGDVVTKISLLDINLCLSQPEGFVVINEPTVLTNSSLSYSNLNPVPNPIATYEKFKDIYSNLD